MGACDPERYAPSRNVPLLAVPPNGIRTEPQLALWAAVVGQAKKPSNSSRNKNDLQ